MDVVAWLRGLGLEGYAPAFRDNERCGPVASWLHGVFCSRLKLAEILGYRYDCL
jgi:hypothetical protein